MNSDLTAGLFALAGGLIGGLISWWIQGARIAADISIAISAIKTDHMAEQAALHYLNHKGYTDRSFELLSTRLGGFEGNELRKILVRAGAVRYTRENGTEWWRLLSRVPEAGERARKAEPLGAENSDL